MGNHQLSCGERDHLADFGLAGDAARQAELFPSFRYAVFTLASALCGMAVSLPLIIAARVLQGVGWRRVAAFEPGHLAGRLSSGEAGAGNDRFRTGGVAGAGHGTYIGRLYNR